MVIPQHVAIILDGNGRWAKSKGMPRNYGHSRGAKNLEVICEDAWNMGIKYLTVYAVFHGKLEALRRKRWTASMRLFRRLHKDLYQDCPDKNKSTGPRRRRSPPALGSGSSGKRPEKAGGVLEGQHRTEFHRSPSITAAGTRSRERSAIWQRDVKDGKLAVDAIDRGLHLPAIWTQREVPDPDLLIRTSGEQRLSNYLLWQLAYTEFYFTDVPWPAFTKEELWKAIEKFNSRDRRYGGVKEG